MESAKWEAGHYLASGPVLNEGEQYREKGWFVWGQGGHIYSTIEAINTNQVVTSTSWADAILSADGTLITTVHSTNSFGSDYTSQFFSPYTIAKEIGAWLWQSSTGLPQSWDKSSQVIMMFYPGRPVMAGQQVLIEGTATANELQPVSTNLPPPQITIQGIGQLDTNAMVAKTAPAGKPTDFTALALVPLLDFNSSGADRLPVISWQGGPVITNTQNVIVGQKISLTCGWEGGIGRAITNYSWTVPGITFSNYLADANTGKLYADFCKSNDNVNFYWVDGGNPPTKVTCEVTFNGQSLTAKADFDVGRPTATMTATVTGGIRADSNYWKTGAWLHFGGYNVGTNAIHGISFQINGADNSGNLFFVQTGIMHREQLWSNGTNYVGVAGPGIDASAAADNYVYPFDISQGTNATGDSPAAPTLSHFRTVSANDSYTMYLMFMPSNVGDAKAVPLQKVDWSWSATANQTNVGLNLWQLTSATPPSGLSPANTTAHPEWITNLLNSMHWNP